MTTLSERGPVSSIAVTPGFCSDQRATCFLGATGGVLVVHEGKEIWLPSPPAAGMQPVTALAVSYPPPDTDIPHLLVGMQGGIWRVNPNERRWEISPTKAVAPVVSALVLSTDRLQETVMLAGTVEDGIFRSEDGGSRWLPANFGLLDMNVYCLAEVNTAADRRTWFAGTESGVFLSGNAGRAWRETGFPMEGAPVLSLASTASGLLLAGTDSNGILVSDDDGVTWSQWVPNTAPGSVNQILVAETAPDHVFVLHNDSLLFSPNFGSSWTRLDADANTGIAVAAIAKCTSDNIEFVVGYSDGSYGFLRWRSG